ncbi:MAG TPA: response regulator transcription factor [Thermoleophilaceae bacterium]|nr:response regulator transcription factor [Thermoleophilaceae bacterium]
MPSAAVGALRCLIVDDHPVVRQGIRALLERELQGVEVETAATPDAAMEQASGRSPDVVVIDLRRVSGDIQETVAGLQRSLGSPIVVFTADGGPRMLSEALKAGVKGYVRKDSPPEDLIRAIQAARSGEFYVDPALSSSLLLEEGERTLTARQREILQMLADGMHTEQVAKQLGLSTETVRTHTKRILSKLGAGTRTQAVAIGIRSGLIE